MCKTFYITRFGTSGGEGGSSRCAQILDLLTRREREVIQIGSIRGALRAGKRLGRPPIRPLDFWLWAPCFRRHVFQLRWAARLALKENPDLRMARLALIDDPVYFPSISDYLQKLRIPWIAVVHNLESLVPGQTARGALWKLLIQETNALRQANFCLCLSHEEAFLLQNLGIKTRVLPYYPSLEKRSALLRLRTARANTKTEGYFMLGSALNPPTRDGMQRIITEWHRGRLHEKFGVLQVAGYCTDLLHCPSGVQILGRLSDSELALHVTRIRAAICFQERGAGQLTRIMDFLVAGIPVVANRHAARSYQGVAGIQQFEELEELGSALARLVQGPSLPPPLPAEPDAGPTLQAIQALEGTRRSLELRHAQPWCTRPDPLHSDAI